MSNAKQGLNDPEQLILRYFNSPSADLKDMILVQFAGTVERIARRFAGIEPQEDLVQVGYIGLLNALNKFDPEAGVRFNTYATHLIAGEIKHYLRDKSQMIRQPAWLQELRHRVSRTQVRLQAALGRVPTVDEIARECEVSASAVEEVLNSVDTLRVTSFDASSQGDDDSSEIDGLASLDVDQISIEERMVLEQAVSQLRDLEQEVLTRFHFESMSQTEIANELGISCNYVSHILRQSLSKLRRILTSEEVSDQRLRKNDLGSNQEVLDSQVGVYTEKYFVERLNEELHRSNASGEDVSIILCRFDGLQEFANFYGKESMSDFLADAAEHCRCLVRRLDVICKYKKDGFAIILPFTGPTAEVVRNRVEERFGPWLNHRRSPAGPVRISVGSAIYGLHGTKAKQLIQHAGNEIDPPAELAA